MDFDLNSLKQKDQNVGDDILTGAGDAIGDNLKNITFDQKQSSGNIDHSPTKLVDFLEDDNDLKKSTGSSEDFEHVDPTSLTQIADKVNKKFTENTDNLNDFLTSTKSQFDHYKTDFGNEFSQFNKNLDKTAGSNTDWMSNIGEKIDFTKEFMNAERGGFVEQPPQQLSTQQHPFESSESAFDNIIESKVPEAQKAENKFYDDFEDNESPASSYNPSPIKKNPVATAIKESENEKFISSEDLLGDFKEERTTTPDLGQKTANPAIVQNPPPVKEDFSANESKIFEAPIVQPQPIKKDEEKKPSAVEEIKTVVAPSAPTQPAKEQPKLEKKLSIGDSSKGPKIVSVEEIFYKYGLDAWFKPDRLHPIVESLIYWRDVKKSGIVLSVGTLLILALACYSVISVIAYVSLIALTGSIGFRIYKTVMQAVQKTSEGHPFKELLAIDLELSQDKVQNIVSIAVAHINGSIVELRRLFLVEDLVDSIKFGVILWVMTYIGAWFNGLSIVFLTWVSLFTFPKVYENNKQSIDTYLDVVRSKLTEITDKVKVAIPIGKKPVESEKDK